MPCPTLVVAGTHSGVGKTSVTVALAAALRRRGLTVQTFKVGPDYLDPSYLALASGRPCYNLDGWMTGRDYVLGLFARAARDAGVAIVEGVMGLFDGADPATGEGSTAEVARWLGAPVVLVADAHGMSGSLAPLVEGFARFHPGVTVAAVIANRTGSGRHREWLEASLLGSPRPLPPLAGAIERDALPSLPSRHLGLVTASDRVLTQRTLDELASALVASVDLDRLLSIAKEAMKPGAPSSSSSSSPPGPPASSASKRCQLGASITESSKTGDRSSLPQAERAVSRRRTKGVAGPPAFKVRLGVAFDEAFHFYYPDDLEALEGAGVELVRFSPLHDDRLPDGLDGLYLGGGYPEEHAAALSERAPFLAWVRRHAREHKPIYAECGGLMLLSLGIETRDGRRCSMAGLLPAWTRMLDRRKALGYVEVTLTRPSLFGDEGARLRGHEFHYSELATDPCAGSSGWQPVYALVRRRSDAIATEGFQRDQVLASYVHLRIAPVAGAALRFAGALARREEAPR